MNYTTSQNTDLPFPWITATTAPRVGAAITFPAPTIFTQDFSPWRLLASSQVVGAPSRHAAAACSRPGRPRAPRTSAATSSSATFNVFNFFPTNGAEYVAAGLAAPARSSLTAQGNQITTNACGNPATARAVRRTRPTWPASATRSSRRSTPLDADIVSLEELENSVKFGKPRDFAITQLVNALNAAPAPGTWAFVPRRRLGGPPALSEQDVIRTGFIYQPAASRRSGLQDPASARPSFAQRP